MQLMIPMPRACVMTVGQGIEQVYSKCTTIIHQTQQIDVKWGQVENSGYLEIGKGQTDLLQRLKNNGVDLTVFHSVVDWGSGQRNCTLQLQFQPILSSWAWSWVWRESVRIQLGAWRK